MVVVVVEEVVVVREEQVRERERDEAFIIRLLSLNHNPTLNLSRKHNRDSSPIPIFDHKPTLN